MSIENPEFNQPEEEPKIEEVDLKGLKKGDKIVVEMVEGNIYEITIIGKEKGSTKVRFKEISYSDDNPDQPKVEEFTARMPGGFEMHKVEDVDDGRVRAVTKEGAGLTKDIIRSGGENTLYFENIKDAKGERHAKLMSTGKISEILEVERQDKKQEEE